MKENRFYIYAHLTKDTKDIFYIGKGTKRRAWESYGRNQYWKNIVNKHQGFEVSILIDNLNEDYAYLQEFLAIKEFKPKANIKDGGAGGSSEVMKQEWIKREHRKSEIYAKISRSLTGKRLSPEHAEKCKKALVLAKEKLMTKEVQEKRLAAFRKAVVGKKRGPLSKEHSERLRLLKLGSKHSAETNLKRAISMGAKPFLVFDILNNLVGEWINKEECARALNLNGTNINRCLNNKRKTHKGYTFKYKENT